MATIRFYRNTGFDAVNVPESIDMLRRRTPYKTYSNMNIIQSDYLAYVRVDNITATEARNIDYCIVTDDEENDVAYAVDSFEFVAYDVCQFNLYLDAYATIGGLDGNNIIIGGSVKRRHVSAEEDEGTFFTLPEPFSPKSRNKKIFNELVMESEPDPGTETVLIEAISAPSEKYAVPTTTQTIPDSTGTGVTIKDTPVQGNIPPAAQRMMAAYQAQAKSRTDITTPTGKSSILTTHTSFAFKVREIVGTIVGLTKFDRTAVQIDSKTRWWKASEAGSFLADMRTEGRDQDIVSYWVVPDWYIFNCVSTPYQESGDYGGITSITSGLHYIDLLLPFPQGTHNNKAKYAQACTVLVYSPVSGESIEKQLYEIANTDMAPDFNTFQVTCCVAADIRPEGSPIFAWWFNNGVDVRNVIPEVIKGGKWRKISLGIPGLSGAGTEAANIAARARAQLQNVEDTTRMSQITGGLGGALSGALLGAKIGSIVPGVGTAIGAGLGAIIGGLGGAGLAGAQGATSYRNTERTIRSQMEVLNNDSQAASTKLMIGDSTYARDIGKNKFFYCVTMYSDQDLEDFDTFLNNYGYNVGNEPIKEEHFNNREAFNFIQVNDITIKADDTNISYVKQAQEQLKQGIRIWHVMPNSAYMEAGGNEPA